ncbi:MAG TPA: response regulator [Geminicoccaceae bacterium]|nr:response regulator [Geminicoccaceae bacterium]
MRHVLAVDDDRATREMIAAYLGDRGFEVSTAADGDDMADILAREEVDLVVLDLKLADEDGLELLRELRSESELPVIVLTGHRREEIDRIVGLELGADDYLTKPFSLPELLARIRAVLRRSDRRAAAPGPVASPARYRFAGWELSLRTRRLTAPSGEVVPLTRGELSLLTALVRAPRQVLTRQQLLAASRLHDDDVFDRSIDVQILRLRRKLERNPSEPELIRTERGVGYLLAASVETI